MFVQSQKTLRVVSVHIIEVDKTSKKQTKASE